MTRKTHSLVSALKEIIFSQLSPERRYLLNCLRRMLAQNNRLENQAASADTVNWDTFLTLAEVNRLIPILHPLTPLFSDQGMPGHLVESMRRHYLSNAHRAFIVMAELARVAESMARNGIKVFPLKGSLLALQLYGDISRRYAGDIDILVEAAQVQKAYYVLRELGYRCAPKAARLQPSRVEQYKVLNKDGSFFHTELGIMVDLHWRLLGERHLIRNNDTGWFGEKREYREMGRVAFPCMDRERLLLYLCLHGSIHLWERLFWLYDVATLIRQNPDLDWDHIITEAEGLGCLRSLLLGTVLVHLLLETPVPDVLHDRWEQTPALRYLCLRSYPCSVNPILPPKTVTRSVRHFCYAIRLRDLRQNVPYLIHKIFLPGKEWPDVPIALLPVYFILKPIIKARIISGRPAGSLR